MSDRMIYEDIFEAIRKLEDGNPIINLKDKSFGYLKRNLHFNIMEMPDGTIGAFPHNMFIGYFRGENNDYDDLYPCVPSIFRIKRPEDAGEDGYRKQDLIVIDELKILEFELIIKQFPQVNFALQDYCNVDFIALAQHYELNTNLLDVTSDIAVAAFFATHYYDSEKNDYLIKEDGIGCLRAYYNIMIEYDENQPFKLIGLQPFKRPGLQCAFAVKMGKDENFANFSNKVLFKQSPKWNQKIHDLFYNNGKNILFPDEEIVEAARKVKESMKISKYTIEKYCNINQKSIEYVNKILNNYGYDIVENLNYKLSRQQRRKLQREYKGRPYGDAVVRSRLTYIP